MTRSILTASVLAMALVTACNRDRSSSPAAAETSLSVNVQRTGDQAPPAAAAPQDPGALPAGNSTTVVQSGTKKVSVARDGATSSVDVHNGKDHGSIENGPNGVTIKGTDGRSVNIRVPGAGL